MSLMTTPTLIKLYDDASSKNSREKATTKLISHFFQKMVFSDERWMITQEQHPDNSLESGDLSVTYYDNRVELTFLVWDEDKKADANESTVRQNETQALRKSQRLLKANDQSFVYVTTSCGPSIKQWIYRSGSPHMVPFDPLVDPSDKSIFAGYIDLGSPQARDRLLAGFERMKNFPPRAYASHAQSGQLPSSTLPLFPDPQKVSRHSQTSHQPASGEFSYRQEGYDRRPPAVSNTSSSQYPLQQLTNRSRHSATGRSADQPKVPDEVEFGWTRDDKPRWRYNMQSAWEGFPEDQWDHGIVNGRDAMVHKTKNIFAYKPRRRRR